MINSVNQELILKQNSRLWQARQLFICFAKRDSKVESPLPEEHILEVCGLISSQLFMIYSRRNPRVLSRRGSHQSHSLTNQVSDQMCSSCILDICPHQSLLPLQVS